MSMSKDDEAYSALLVQLFSDYAIARDTHVSSDTDRPDSPLLPPFTAPTSSPCQSYDVPPSAAQDSEMASEFYRCDYDKPLPALPPSPASSFTSLYATYSHSSTRISRLFSFTSTLSLDRGQPQEIPPPPPVPVMVHGEYQRNLVLRRNAQYFTPITDKDSFQPSPTSTNFSSVPSRKVSAASFYSSFPVSPTSTNTTFSLCAPENIALPESPLDDQKPCLTTAHDLTPSSRSARSLSLPKSPSKIHIFPTSPTSRVRSATLALPAAEGATNHFRLSKPASHSQLCRPVTTTASFAPSTVELKHKDIPDTRTSKDKSPESPKKRTGFINLISRLSFGRNDHTTSDQTLNGVENDGTNDSRAKAEKKPRKSTSKKVSLASIRTSFSISRASFSSRRPSSSSSIEDVPPLPTQPTLVTPVSEPIPSEALSKPCLSRVPSHGDLLDSTLHPMSLSASTTTTFQSTSQLSIIDPIPRQLALDSHGSLESPIIKSNGPPIRASSKSSVAGVEPVVSTMLESAVQATGSKSKSTSGVTAKLKTVDTGISRRLPVTGYIDLLPYTEYPRIPQGPTDFNPPAKLATRSRRARGPTGVDILPYLSKFPMPPSHIPKPSEKPLVLTPPSAPPPALLV